MIRGVLALLLLPAVLEAQQTYAGVRAGRNVADLPDGSIQAGPLLGVFGDVDLSDRLGVGFDLVWFRSAVEDYLEPWRSTFPPVAEPEYVLSDLVGRTSWDVHLSPLSLDLGVAFFGGGWMGVRTGGSFVARSARRFDFGHLWGMSLFGVHGRVKLETSLRFYHGERAVWQGGDRQRGSHALIGMAYRIR